jgi:hypothetical protein
LSALHRRQARSLAEAVLDVVEAWTKSALATTVCGRTSFSIVKPAPFAPGIAPTANAAISVSVSCSGR